MTTTNGTTTNGSTSTDTDTETETETETAGTITWDTCPPYCDDPAASAASAGTR